MRFPRALNGAVSPGTWRFTTGEWGVIVSCPQCGSAIHLPRGVSVGEPTPLTCPSRSCAFEDDEAVLCENAVGVVTQP